MKKVHNFVWMGGVFAILICSIMSIVHPMSNISKNMTVINIALYSVAVAILGFIILPTWKMVKKSLPDDAEKSEIRPIWLEEKLKFGLPLLALLAFGFIFIGSQVKDIYYNPLLKTGCSAIGTIAFLLIFAFGFEDPKKESKLVAMIIKK